MRLFRFLPSLRLVCGLASAAVATIAAFAQGSLTPPGAPGPTMKTLDQIEARIPLVAGSPGVTIDATSRTITISQPGSYYLTGNLTILPGGSPHGIVINSGFVTLDLNGFTLFSTVASASGAGVAFTLNNADDFYSGHQSHVVIRNGFIRGGATHTGYNGPLTAGPGFSVGVGSINDYTPNTFATVVEQITVADISGTAFSGVSTIRYCTVNRCFSGASAQTVENSHFTNLFGGGVSCEIIRDSTVDAINLDGGNAVYAITASGTRVRATGTNAVALMALEQASNCVVYASGLATCGLVTGVAINCVANTGAGRGTPNASSYTTAEGDPIALLAFQSAHQCSAYALTVALKTPFAVGCNARSGAILAGQKYNMP